MCYFELLILVDESTLRYYNCYLWEEAEEAFLNLCVLRFVVRMTTDDRMIIPC
jgi:hypothetical protein